ncbi:MAG: CotH kinase family protein [Cellvibrio sp.]|uniref:CotH kinase family protein n=1 Tax=Cellvibrio sp. TaxID=1965322 RepID=UPI0031B2163E
MSVMIRFGIIFIGILLQGCGGGNSSTTDPSVPRSATTSSVVSILSSSSLSSGVKSFSSSSTSSRPADFPTGIAESLPVLNISTNDSAPILSKETYLKGTFALTGDGVEQVDGALEIRGRGNATWEWDKKPFRLKLNQATELLGMPASKHWVLLANYADKTLIRNDIALRFGRTLGMEYVPRNQHVELTLNGVYQGVYQLTEQIRIAKDRVNIPELKVDDTEAEKITGGYLMELDFRMDKDFCNGPGSWKPFCNNGVNTDREKTFCVDSQEGMSPICVDTPETLLDTAWSAQREYIQSYLIKMESALFSANFTDPTTGYAAYIDVDSAINYYLLNELFKNVDGAITSFYIYKKRNGKVFFGPIWDFDWALGNAGVNAGVEKTSGWHIRNAPWFNRLLQDPAFEAKVKARWQTLKVQGQLEEMFEYAEARALWLGKAQARNFDVWNIFYWEAFYTRVVLGSYELEVKEMIRWQRERSQWMDAQLSQ